MPRAGCLEPNFKIIFTDLGLASLYADYGLSFAVTIGFTIGQVEGVQDECRVVAVAFISVSHSGLSLFLIIAVRPPFRQAAPIP